MSVNNSLVGNADDSLVSNADDSLAGLLAELLKLCPNLNIFKLISPTLTNGEFDEILEPLFEEAIRYIEKNARNYANSSEEAITGLLGAHLSQSAFLDVTREADSNGHVDITITRKFPPRFERLGEAKIYDGAVYHVGGLEQLVDRYSSGRDSSGFIVEYVKIKNIKELVNKLRSHLNDEKPCSQIGVSQDHKIQWAFVTYHDHHSGEPLRVIHLNCNLYVAPQVGKKQSKPKKK